jgi:DNA ligase (NAD+)
MNKKIKELEAEIIRHKNLYYSGKAEISDLEFDRLEDELRKIDPNNYVLEVIGSTQLGDNKIAHENKMLSLDKTYKFEDLIKWAKGHDLVSTFKIDGSSCSIIYDEGKFKLAKTRGDGSFGENITSKALFIDEIPKKIKNKNIIEVRGEIFCTEENFYKIFNEMKNLELDTPSSQRNIVAGLLGRKENIFLNRFLSFQAFEVIFNKSECKNEVEKFHELQKNKFNIPDFTYHKDEKNIQKSIDEAQLFMSEGGYLIDGLVFTYNDLSLHEELGSTAHHPRYKMAFKFQGDTKKTTIINIEWGVSRNGTLTPVANVEPIELSGATVSRVTLHNFGLVIQNNLKVGDEIEIIRSGEVIPKFLQVIKSKKGSASFPEKCPSCNQKIYQEEIRLICKNENCPEKKLDEILNFVQKIGIEEISQKRLKEMIKVGIVKNIDDLFYLTKEDFLKLDKVKDKLADKFVETINNSKKVELVTFLASLGIKGGAFNKCEKIVNSGFNTVDKILKLDVKHLMEVDTFAEKSASEFISSLTQKRPLIEKLVNEVGFKFEKKRNASEKLNNKSFCITGSLSMKRSDMEKIIKENGGIVMSDVSKNLSYLVTNDKESTSSKFVKASKLGIPIINEDTLMRLINE